MINKQIIKQTNKQTTVQKKYKALAEFSMIVEKTFQTAGNICFCWVYFLFRNNQPFNPYINMNSSKHIIWIIFLSYATLQYV